MYAITISQPYADKIAIGEKWVENRNMWRYAHRGVIAIHAGKGTQYLDRLTLMRDYACGCIVAVGRLVNVYSLVDLHSFGRETIIYRNKVERITVGNILDHKHTEGPVCLVLASVVALDKPVPCRGNQGLWDVPELAERMVREQVERSEE